MSEMIRAYDLAARAVRQRLAEQHPDQLATLAEIPQGEVAVFSGVHDSVQEVLRRLGVPFALDPKKLAARAVFANCPGTGHPVLTGQIEAHVRAGGWLVSSDWALTNVVQQAFPNTIRYAGGKSTGDEVVAVEPALDSVWSEVVVLGADPQWWLEGASYPITVLDPERVRIEAASHEMLVKYQAPVVAVRFDWGAGQVFHVVSHFWLKRSRVPHERYRRPGVDFLERGMKLSEEGIEAVLRDVKMKPDELTFAAVQSAVTTTELVARLCILAREALTAKV